MNAAAWVTVTIMFVVGVASLAWGYWLRRNESDDLEPIRHRKGTDL